MGSSSIVETSGNRNRIIFSFKNRSKRRATPYVAWTLCHSPGRSPDIRKRTATHCVMHACLVVLPWDQHPAHVSLLLHCPRHLLPHARSQGAFAAHFDTHPAIHTSVFSPTLPRSDCASSKYLPPGYLAVYSATPTHEREVSRRRHSSAPAASQTACSCCAFASLSACSSCRRTRTGW